MADSPGWYSNDWGVGDFIRDSGLSFHLGNAVKYIARAGKKPIEGQSLQYAYIKDLKKAIHYLENELQHATCGGIPPQVRSTYQPPTTLYTEDFDR